SMTFTMSCGLVVHIFASSPARIFTRLSPLALLASLSVGTELDGSDCGSSTGAAAMAIFRGEEAGSVDVVSLRKNPPIPKRTASAPIAQMAILQSRDIDRLSL